MNVLAAAVLLFAIQDPAKLIERLGSGDIAERERAFVELEKAGAKAEAHLKRAAAGSDAGLALHASRLLRIHELERLFSPALKTAVPGIARRIALDEPVQWTQIYLEIFGKTPSGNELQAFPELTRRDLEPLARPALERASTEDQVESVCEAIAQWNHRSTIPALARLLKDANRENVESALEALIALEGRGAVPVAVAEIPEHHLGYVLSDLYPQEPVELEQRLLARVRRTDPESFSNDLNNLRWLESRELSSVLPWLMRHPFRPVRLASLKVIKDWSDKRQATLVLEALADSNSEIRQEAAELALKWGLPTPSKTVEALLKDSDSQVRCQALVMASRTQDPSRFDALRRGLEDSDATVRWWAAEFLLKHWKPEDEPRIIRLLSDPNENVRISSLEGWHRIKGPQAIPLLGDTLRDEAKERSERCRALALLRDLGAAPGRDELAALIKTAPAGLCAGAAWTMVVADPNSLTPELIDRLVTVEKEANSGDLLEILLRSRSEARLGALTRLFDATYTTRLGAARALYELGDPRTVTVLRDLLDSDSGAVRRVACQLLGNWNGVEARPVLAKLLVDERLFMAALYALDRMGPGDEMATIRSLLTHEETWTRRQAAEVLARHGDRESIPILEKWLDDPAARAEAAEYLYDLGEREFIPRIADWIDSSESNRRSLEELVLLLRPPQTLPKLIRALEDRRADRRSWAVWMLGEWGDASIAPRLVPSLAEPETASQATQALIRLNSRAVVPDVLKLISDPCVAARRAAARVLAGLDAREAAPRIRFILDDVDCGVREAAAEAAGRLKDEEAAPALIRRLEDPGRTVRAAAARSLGQLRYAGAARALIACLEDASAGVRKAARISLMEMNAAGFREEVLKRFRDPTERDQAAYVELLSDVKAREAIPELMKLLNHDEVGYAARGELVELGAPEALAALRSLEGETESTAEALARLGDVSKLEAMLTDDDPDRRLTAARFFCSEGDRRGAEPLLRLLEATDLSQLPHESSDG